MKKNENGFGLVGIILIVVVVGLLGTAGWLVYDRQKSDPSNETSNIETTESGADTNQSSNDSSKNSDTTVGASDAYALVMKEWGLQFTIPEGLTDIKYVINGDTAAFFAKPKGANVDYISDYDKFEDSFFQYATGVLYRSNESTNGNSAAGIREGKKIGDYYYYTAWAFSSLASGAGCVGLYGGSSESNCNLESDAFHLVNDDANSLLNSIKLAEH